MNWSAYFWAYPYSIYLLYLLLLNSKRYLWQGKAPFARGIFPSPLTERKISDSDYFLIRPSHNWPGWLFNVTSNIPHGSILSSHICAKQIFAWVIISFHPPIFLKLMKGQNRLYRFFRKSSFPIIWSVTHLQIGIALFTKTKIGMVDSPKLGNEHRATFARFSPCVVNINTRAQIALRYSQFWRKPPNEHFINTLFLKLRRPQFGGGSHLGVSAILRCLIIHIIPYSKVSTAYMIFLS